MRLQLPGMLLLLASAAFADEFTVYLDQEFSGGTLPAGVRPWVTATFQDVVGAVNLTITAPGLTGNEYITAFYFNFNPSKNAALFLPSAPGGGTQTDWNLIGGGNDGYAADGDSFFDFMVEFPPPPGRFGNKFTAGETFILNITGVTTADFNFVNISGPPSKTGFYAAAHVGPGEDGGWIAGDLDPNPPQTVPEPTSVVLLGTALVGVCYVLRRRFCAG